MLKAVPAANGELRGSACAFWGGAQHTPKSLLCEPLPAAGQAPLHPQDGQVGVDASTGADASAAWVDLGAYDA